MLTEKLCMSAHFTPHSLRRAATALAGYSAAQAAWHAARSQAWVGEGATKKGRTLADRALAVAARCKPPHCTMQVQPAHKNEKLLHQRPKVHPGEGCVFACFQNPGAGRVVAFDGRTPVTLAAWIVVSAAKGGILNQGGD